jgi:hypothetical protein
MKHRLEWRNGRLYLGETELGDDELDAARKMLALALAAPSDSFTTYRGDMACFSAGVAWAAAHEIRERPSDSDPSFVKYRTLEERGLGAAHVGQYRRRPPRR